MIDEIDGLPASEGSVRLLLVLRSRRLNSVQSAVKALLAIARGADGKNAKKKQKSVQRPIICICNNEYELLLHSQKIWPHSAADGIPNADPVSINDVS